MSENNGIKILLAFAAGAAVGAAIGYFLNSDKKEELIEELKEGAGKLRHDLEENLDKVKEVVSHFTRDAADSSSKNPS